MAERGDVLLEIGDVHAGYGFLEVLHGVSLRMERGEFVAILGANGAGKSTLLRSIVGLVRPSAGQIVFEGRAIHGLSADVIKRRGIGLVSESLNLFAGMTVYENLVLGAHTVRDRRAERERLEFINGLFPRLTERKGQLAGTLSGGERKMLAIGRALMGAPTLLLVDEPSLGLAPAVTAMLFQTLRRLNADGLSILLVEQNVPATLALVGRACVLEQGLIILDRPAAELAQSDYVKKAYMGIGA